MDPILWIVLAVILGGYCIQGYDTTNETLVNIGFMVLVTLMVIGTFVFNIRKNKKRIEEKKKRIEEKKKA